MVAMPPRREGEIEVTGTNLTTGAQASLRGQPQVLDTGTLTFGDQIVRLRGVEGEGGRMARQLDRFLHRREVTCALGSEEAHCTLDGRDVAEMIVSAGGARARSDAPNALLAAEEQARSARLGLWRRNR